MTSPNIVLVKVRFSARLSWLHFQYGSWGGRSIPVNLRAGDQRALDGHLQPCTISQTTTYPQPENLDADSHGAPSTSVSSPDQHPHAPAPRSSTKSSANAPEAAKESRSLPGSPIPPLNGEPRGDPRARSRMDPDLRCRRPYRRNATGLNRPTSRLPRCGRHARIRLRKTAPQDR